MYISNDSNVILKYFHFALLVVFFKESQFYREKKYNILDRQHIASQWGLQLIFRIHNSDPKPQGVENRNILLRFKCVLTALHVNCNLRE
jgi:hypothetical protein